MSTGFIGCSTRGRYVSGCSAGVDSSSVIDDLIWTGIGVSADAVRRFSTADPSFANGADELPIQR